MTVVVVALVGCVDHQEGITATQSLKVELLPPTDPGTPDDRLDPTAPGGRDVTIKITAYGPDNMVDPTFDDLVDVRAQFLGRVTPDLGEPALSTIQVTAGVSADTLVTLPAEVFGPTLLWVEDAHSACPHPALPQPIECDPDPGTPEVCPLNYHCGPQHTCIDICDITCDPRPGAPECPEADYHCGSSGTCTDVFYATGTSPTLWYRDPFIADVQRPADEGSLDALIASPLEDRQIRVQGSRYNDPATCPTEDCGRLIVTSIYAQGYTVSDVECGPGGTPPCVAGDYDHLLIFTFQRPRDENFCDIVVGEFIDAFGGAVSEFNGLTEIGFPQTFVAATEGRNPDEFNNCDGRIVDLAAMPAPKPIENSWLTNDIEFERAEAGLVSVDSAVLMPGFPVACPLDMEYDEFKQWELDIGSGCGSPISAITSGTVSSWIPEDHVGQQLTRVVGSLRPVNFASGGGVWIVYPRSEADLVP